MPLRGACCVPVASNVKLLSMRFPLVICSHNRLIVAPAGWFDSIGHLDADQSSLRMNVSALGPMGLSWFLDADGNFFKLVWQGVEPTGFLQMLRLRRPVENYGIDSPKPITVGQLRRLVAETVEQFEEATNSADLRTILRPLAETELVDRQLMSAYLGEAHEAAI